MRTEDAESAIAVREAAKIELRHVVVASSAVRDCIQRFAESGLVGKVSEAESCRRMLAATFSVNSSALS